MLDYRASDVCSLLAALELDDAQLIDALAGHRRRELHESWAQFRDRTEDGPGLATGSTCRHRHSWPRQLAERPGSPRMLHVAPCSERLRRLTAAPTVAIVGSADASDYGREVASSLARGLSVSGVTIVSPFAEGIGIAAHAGALEVDCPVVAVMAGGVDQCRPRTRRHLYGRVTDRGCAVAELPCGTAQRRWAELARKRVVAALADLTIVVEASNRAHALLEARIAVALGRTAAAVPGRVTSPQARGTAELLIEGAPLVRGPGDALAILAYARDEQLADATDADAALPELGEHCSRLEPRLRAVLERVGSGCDTLAELTASGDDPGDTMLALTELECLGLLARGRGGCYVPRESLTER